MSMDTFSSSSALFCNSNRVMINSSVRVPCSPPFHVHNSIEHRFSDRLPSETTKFSTIATRAVTTNTSSTTKKPEIRTKLIIEPSLPNTLFNFSDDMINTFVDPPTHPSLDPKHALSKIFAPVHELPPTICPIIEGTLPSCLNGAYIRNGPNPQYLPQGPYHLQDGDGMLHSLLISNGRATFCSRYVKTYKYLTEHNADCPLFPNIFSGFNSVPAILARGALSVARVLYGQYDPSKGIGLANINLAFFGDRLFALGQADLPYQLRLGTDGDIETIGRHDFDGKMWMSMTPHPKIDRETGEVFAFRYSQIPPFLTLFRFDAKGRNLQQQVPIFSMTRPTFVHDFAITKKYAVFADTQLRNPMELINGGSIGPDFAKDTRIGVIPRYAKDGSDMKWFKLSDVNYIRAINAWDDGEDGLMMIVPNIIKVQCRLKRIEVVYRSVEKVKINLKTGCVCRWPLARNLDFGVINPAFIGKENRFGYAAVTNCKRNITGVVKLDWSPELPLLRNKVVGSRKFETGCYGGEPFFVAKEDSKEEDDGYVVTYVHDENAGDSQFLVMDAKSPSLDIVAAVKLPRRVPCGFHGLFVSENDLRKQRL